MPDVRREGAAGLPHGAGVAPAGRARRARSSTCSPTAGRKPHAVLEEELLEASDDGAPIFFTTAEDRGQRLARAYHKRERVMKKRAEV